MSRYNKTQYILFIEYISCEGKKVITKSKPTTWKSAHRRKRECIALKKGTRVWVEKKPFTLSNDNRLLTAERKY